MKTSPKRLLAIFAEKTGDIAAAEDAIPDNRPVTMLIAAHTAIDVAVRTPLMLQTGLRVEGARITEAFLVLVAAMARRLVRAKAKIKGAAIPFLEPPRSDAAELNGDRRALRKAFQSRPDHWAAMGRAAAFGEAFGSAARLSALDQIAPGDAEAFQPYLATRAALLSAEGRDASAAYERAVALCVDALARTWLLRRSSQGRQQVGQTEKTSSPVFFHVLAGMRRRPPVGTKAPASRETNARGRSHRESTWFAVSFRPQATRRISAAAIAPLTPIR